MMSLRQANAIIDSAFVKAAEDGVPPLAVVILDESGNIVSAQRQDGASMFRIDVALGKAWATVAMGISSRTIAKQAQDNPNFYAALASTARGRFLPQPGAIPIRDAKQQLIGAAGASGGTGDQDEVCCVYGVQQVGLVADA